MVVRIKCEIVLKQCMPIQGVLGLWRICFTCCKYLIAPTHPPSGMERIICKCICFSASGMIWLGGRGMASAYRFQSTSSSCLGYEVYSGDVATLLTTVEAEVAEKKWEVMTVEIKLFDLKF